MCICMRMCLTILILGGQKLIPLLNQYNLFDILLTLLESNDTSLIDAACRTLKTISLYDFAAKSHVFQVSHWAVQC